MKSNSQSINSLLNNKIKKNQLKIIEAAALTYQTRDMS